VLLPALGTVCQIVQANTGRTLAGRRSVNLALVAVGALALVSWGQHMFVSGLIEPARVAFMLTSMAVAVPIGFILFSWIATLWVSRIRYDTPLVFALGFVSVLLLAGLSGLMLAAVPVNQQLHGTYFVLGHSHLALAGVVMSGLIAGIYYVFPGLTGKAYDDTLGKVHFLIHFGGVHMAFVPMFVLGLLGVPRRVVGIGAELEPLVLATGAGAMALAVASLMFLYNLFFAWRAERSGMRSSVAAPGS
jgi:cytochrome c oxidase subunit 1